MIDEEQLNSKDLLFLTNETKSFQFKLHASVQEMGKTLEVRYYVLYFDSILCIIVCWCAGKSLSGSLCE